jgi:hypothetical protein
MLLTLTICHKAAITNHIKVHGFTFPFKPRISLTAMINNTDNHTGTMKMLVLSLLALGALVERTTGDEYACEFDYSIVKTVGGGGSSKISQSQSNDVQDLLPIRVTQQSISSVTFDVINIWTTDEVDQIYVSYQTSRWSGDRICLVEQAVPSQQPSHSSLTAHCNNHGTSLVHVFVSDPRFDFNNDNVTIPTCCYPDPDAQPMPTIEYLVAVNCRSTCTSQIPPLKKSFNDSSIVTPAPTPVPTTVHTLGCLDDNAVVLTEFQPGDILDLQISPEDGLCTLVEVTVDSNGTVVGDLKPVGRSYHGHPWEPYAGDFAYLDFDCSTTTGQSSTSSCLVVLPPPQKTKVYALKGYKHGHQLSDRDLGARFLEKTTYGPTRASIDDLFSFGSPAAWLQDQIKMPLTSHRQYFRERVTGWHSETSEVGLLHTGACEKGARFRQYALLWIESGRFIDIEQSPYDEKKLILSVEGQVRTVVDGPLQFGTQRELHGNATAGR